MEHNFGTASGSSLELSKSDNDNNNRIVGDVRHERPVISVIIDEDEDDEEEEEEGEEEEPTDLVHNQPEENKEPEEASAEQAQAEEEHDDEAAVHGSEQSIQSDHLSSVKQLTSLNLDHDYVSASQKDESPAKMAAPQMKHEFFPVMHGLNIDQTEEETSKPVLPLPSTFPPYRHVQRRAIKLPRYGTDDFYSQQHPKGTLLGPLQKHHAHSAAFISSGALPPPMRQLQQRHASPRLSFSRTPSSSLQPAAAVAAAGTGGWAHGGAHGQQQHQIRHHAQRALQMMDAATRGGGVSAVHHLSNNNNNSRGSRAVSASQIPVVKRTYSSNSASMIKRQQYEEQKRNVMGTSREQHNQPQQLSTFADVVAEEDFENEKFFSQLDDGKQQQHQQLRGRRPKKQQNEDIFDDANITYQQLHHQQQQQQESSKPPDDPVPPVGQNQHHRSIQNLPQQQQYESSIDSAIDSVVRGDALVMQNFSGTSATHASPSSPGFDIGGGGGVSVTAPSPTLSSSTTSTVTPVHNQQQQQQFLHPSYTTATSLVTTMPSSPVKQQHYVVELPQQSHKQQPHYRQRHPSVPFIAPPNGGGNGSDGGTTMMHQPQSLLQHHHPAHQFHHQRHAMMLDQHAFAQQQQRQSTYLEQTTSQSLEDLADLAQASSNLLQQTTSSMLRAPAAAATVPHTPLSSSSAVVSGAAYRQKEVQPVHQQTMHFKVVATNDNSRNDNHSAESYHQQEYRQQVFSVQKQREDEANISRNEHHLRQQHQQRPTSKSSTVVKKLTKKQMETIQREFAELLPYGGIDGTATGPTSAPTLHQQKEKVGYDATNQQKRLRTSKEETEATKDGGENDRFSDRPVRRSIPVVGVKRSAEIGGEQQKLGVDEGTNAKKKRTWEDTDYVTRCICGMVHTDPFMIQCDQCDVWQHGVCMGITSKRAVPDQYFCEQCKPRALLLSASQAAAKQKAFMMTLPPAPSAGRRGRKSNKFKLQQQQRLLQQRKQILARKPSNTFKQPSSSLSANNSQSTATSQLGAVLRGERIAPKRGRGRPPRQQQQTPVTAPVTSKADWSTDADVSDAVGATDVPSPPPSDQQQHRRDSTASDMRDNNAETGDAIDVKTQQQQHPTTKEMVVQQPTLVENCYSRAVKALMTQLVPDSRAQLASLQRLKSNSPLTRQMYVAPNVEGLVATPGDMPILAGTPLIEYNGMISLLSEVQTRAPDKLNQQNFTLVYKGLGDGKELFVDATRMLSDARSVRKSCRPNAAVRHAISEGQIHIYLVATTDIDKSNEVTIPFDSDYWDSCVPVACACGFSKNPSSSTSSEKELLRCPVQEFNEALISGDMAIFQEKKMKRMTRSISNAAANVVTSSGMTSSPPGRSPRQQQTAATTSIVVKHEHYDFIKLYAELGRILQQKCNDKTEDYFNLPADFAKI